MRKVPIQVGNRIVDSVDYARAVSISTCTNVQPVVQRSSGKIVRLIVSPAADGAADQLERSEHHNSCKTIIRERLFTDYDAKRSCGSASVFTHKPLDPGFYTSDQLSDAPTTVAKRSLVRGKR